MFGRIPRLPIDIMFHHVLENDSIVSHHEFVSHLRRDLSEAAQIARQHSYGEQNCHAKIYNRKVNGVPLMVGDRVLLANRGEKGKKKVADRWDSTPFDVVSVKPEINVYRIRDAVTGREKVVHRNMLLPVDFLSFPEPTGSQAVSGKELPTDTKLQSSPVDDVRQRFFFFFFFVSLVVVEMTDMKKDWSISFAGCGFMGIYYVGATSCILERFPGFIRDASKIYGASAGALMAAILTVGIP
ncbi:hypothetical protein L3Q82_023710, partial [Scortum barcoo]